MAFYLPGSTKLYALTFILALLSSCQQDDELRTYRENPPPKMQKKQESFAHPPVAGMDDATRARIEKDMQASQSTMANDADSDIPAINWSLPADWQELAPSGILLKRAQKDGMEASLVYLRGDGGGMEANLDRWADQLGLSLSKEHKSAILKKAGTAVTQDKAPAQILDYTILTDKADAPAMIVAWIQYPQGILFAKWKGNTQQLQKNRPLIPQTISTISMPGK